ncbi:MAG: thioredoxin domain-containing protein [Halobacteriaceae archaeon]
MTGDDADAAPWARNRLDEEASPYLRQHADNPVHWQPWDATALAAARERDVPVFLSIGYAACHWCHVMEEESFSDPEIAARLNEDFVPVKVDREERPDVDSVYMTVCQQVTGRGGWPLSAFLTPAGKPFYVATYLPPEPTRGQPGFGQLLEDVAAAWADPEERAEIEDRAEQWAAVAAEELESVPDGTPGAAAGDAPPDAAGDASTGEGVASHDASDGGPLLAAAEAAVRTADREFGGFGRDQKFPHPARLRALLRAHDRIGRETFRDVAVETLDAMADGGLRDQLGGGFHRYTTDREWVVPHFEKMLYDNATLPRAYLAAHQVTGDERYAAVARETFAFLDRELSHPEGGFFSSLDARSPPPASRRDGGGDGTADATAAAAGGPAADDHGEEGAYYVWTPDEVHAALDDPLDADLFCDRYGVDEVGDVAGKSVLTQHASVAELADASDLDEPAVVDRLAAAEYRLREVRAERPRPPRDEKVIAGWNGLAIRALADGARILNDDAYAARAATALGFVRAHCWDADAGRLARRYADGDAAGAGYLEDYAFLADGALALYGVTGEVDHLAFALDLTGVVVAEFWDAEAETLYFTPASGEDLIARPQSVDDSSTPSATGVAADVLLALDHFRADDAFADVAAATLDTHAPSVRESPLRHVSLALATDALATGHLEVTAVLPEPANGLPAALRGVLADTYLPGLVLAPRPADDADLAEWLERLDLDGAEPPVWAGRDGSAGEDGSTDDAPTSDAAPTYYVCRRACSPPLTDAAAVPGWAADLGPHGT